VHTKRIKAECILVNGIYQSAVGYCNAERYKVANKGRNRKDDTYFDLLINQFHPPFWNKDGHPDDDFTEFQKIAELMRSSADNRITLAPSQAARWQWRNDVQKAESLSQQIYWAPSTPARIGSSLTSAQRNAACKKTSGGSLVTVPGTYTYTAVTIGSITSKRFFKPDTNNAVVFTGVISETPLQTTTIIPAGTTHIRVAFKPTDQALYDPKMYNFTLDSQPAPTPVVVVPSTIPQGTVGETYRLQLSATPSASSWSATGLPTNLSISNSGLISGTPTVAGDFRVSVTAMNSAGSGRATFTIHITLSLPVSAGLSMWLDASQITGVANNQTLSVWPDNSGKGNDAVRQTQSSSGYPKFIAAGVGEYPVV